MQQRDNLLLTRMLAQYLSHRDAPLDEKEILEIFQQMVAAIRHIHEHNILHRDMKTANIFLTKEGVVKVGDFGISKIMSTTDKGANTVLGTPYYISPEMCEGKEYNDKSDIWALGCILYEMACLQKTFEGSNLPALVNKIMKGQFAPVKGNYSEDFKNLIKDMLEHEPEYRPSANELMYRRLPERQAASERPRPQSRPRIRLQLHRSRRSRSDTRIEAPLQDNGRSGPELPVDDFLPDLGGDVDAPDSELSGMSTPG
ncbi:serine/threonine-protein kinase Nek8-like isoform X3 [Lineus longissimus]|uniref:serine/threonine-protein kinase Nek8-like isoform X3 n=1 Tax=Lineus longissimus TaxID=88925 RepID=UPI00315D2626